MRRKITAKGVSCLLSGLACSASVMATEPFEGEHKFELKLRGAYFNEESTAYPTSTTPTPRPSKYEQAALGTELNYQSPFLAGIIGADISGYTVMKLGDSGTPTTSLVEVGNNGQLQSSYSTIGQAYLKLKKDDIAQLKIGRQIQNSLLLKSSTTRAVPDTFSGVSGSVTPIKGLSAYGAWYDQWRSRSTGEFVRFRTEATATNVPNAIDYVSIAGLSYTRGPVAVTAEYLNSKNYLSKYGLVGVYTIPLGKNSVKFSSGAFTSRGDGYLMVCSAEKEMDCTGTGRIQNNGLGVYLDSEWKIHNYTVGLAVAKFQGFWIEDNFAVNAKRSGSLTQDHGTNPFPTSAGLGPDLTNDGETVGSIRFSYDWKEHINGLKTSVKYSRGTGAKSSNLVNNARGSERYRELDVIYALPFAKGLSLRYTYLNYDSNIEGGTVAATIKGMTRQDWEQHRFYIDYSYKF